MIEDIFRKWVEFELDHGCYGMDDLKSCLDDDDDADVFWDEFEKYHCEGFRELVRQQVKAILKKRNGKL